MAKHKGTRSIKNKTSYNYNKAFELISKAQRNSDPALTLSNMSLNEVPQTICNLTKLKVLDLMDNNISELPDKIYQLSNLQTLFISKNNITVMQNSISMLSKLNHLSLALNNLATLPDSVGLLRELKEIRLSFNNITSLPETFYNLSNIDQIDLSHNKLTSISESIGQLTNLKKLNISSNQIQSLPESLKYITSLSELFLHGNDELGIPLELLGPSWNQVKNENMTPAKPAEILEYYFHTRGARRPLNEAKLILVGRGAVGKTSLVNQLVHNRFEFEEKKTDGINITGWNIKINGNEEVRLNIWDFGGQEIMHATHQFFLTQRSLYLLVLNGREGGEDADADYWLKLIESFGVGSPVIVVMNKIKDHRFDLNRRALQIKYPVIRDFIKTDCEKGFGLEELRKVVERETNLLEHLRDPFPVSWFTIKEQLSTMEGNYLCFDSYRKVCEEHGESVKIAQETLATYLHALGIALNFKEDPRLQDTHVLNPHWVTNGIYKVLNSEKLEQQKGEIRIDNLTDILDTKEYPPSMRCFLFDLMRKFDLCFCFPDDDTHYLIPELLDKQEPVEAAEFMPEECLNFQYHYPILPEGLLPRFIVRTHVLSQGLPRWRTGVILSFEGNQALVKADVQDKKVFISVTGGPSTGRRRLLAVIRADFERIHRDINNLQPQEMVPLPDNPNVVVSYQELLVLEQSSMKKFPKVVNGKIININVHDLLNGVDLEGTRRKEKLMDTPQQAVRLFYSYSHKDESLRNELETHLKLMQRQGIIETWHDRQIGAGDDWKERIDDNLERADIILFLVSSDFIASDYCYEIEMNRALERHKKKDACVIPVILRDVNWMRAPFAILQALPKDGLAVMLWNDKDTAWRNVVEGIEKVVTDIGKQRGWSR